MAGFSEVELFDRHRQSLGEAHRACQDLGRNADSERVALKGHHYVALKEALSILEGSARQMAHLRSDARWLKLGVLYAKIMRQVQVKFVTQRWAYFTQLLELFEHGRTRLDDLANRPTGTLGPILPQNPSSWLIMPDYQAPRPRQPPFMLN